MYSLSLSLSLSLFLSLFVYVNKNSFVIYICVNYKLLYKLILTKRYSSYD